MSFIPWPVSTTLIFLFSLFISIITSTAVVPNQINSAAADGAAQAQPNYKINKVTLAASGSCQAGKVYKIATLSNFQKYMNELECLFSAAEPPDFIPEGRFDGVAMSVVNSRRFGALMSLVWDKKIIHKIHCTNSSSSQETYYGWNRVFQRPQAPFVATLGNVSSLNLVAGEHDDGKTSLVLNLGQDLTQMCPEYRAKIRKKYGDIEIRRINLHHALFPIIHMIDVIRFVGKQADGANIFLGKSYFEDQFKSEKRVRTLAYFYLLNYDKRVMARAKNGDSLLPLEKSFSYNLAGMSDILFGALVPINQPRTTPRVTLREMIQSFGKLATKSILYLNELPFGLSAVRQVRRNFREEFRG